MKVAIALIMDEQNRLLITQRPLHASHGGFWEFPGGKVEEGESEEGALLREMREELGIDVRTFQFLGEIKHDYPKHSVELFVFKVTQFTGTPRCLDGQLNMRWLEKNKINHDEFPAANRGILDLIT